MPYKLVKKRYHFEAKLGRDNLGSQGSPRSTHTGSDGVVNDESERNEEERRKFGAYVTPLRKTRQTLPGTSSSSHHSHQQKIVNQSHSRENDFSDNYSKAYVLYDGEGASMKREKSFLDKYTSCKSEALKEKIAKQHEQEKKKLKEKARVHKQLFNIRTEFAFCKAVRTRQQYVTTRLLEHEKDNRITFENNQKISQDTVVNRPKIKTRKPKVKIDEHKIKEAGKLRYSKYMFHITYPNSFLPASPPTSKKHMDKDTDLTSNSSPRSGASLGGLKSASSKSGSSPRHSQNTTRTDKMPGDPESVKADPETKNKEENI